MMHKPNISKLFRVNVIILTVIYLQSTFASSLDPSASVQQSKAVLRDKTNGIRLKEKETAPLVEPYPYPFANFYPDFNQNTNVGYWKYSDDQDSPNVNFLNKNEDIKEQNVKNDLIDNHLSKENGEKAILQTRGRGEIVHQNAKAVRNLDRKMETKNFAQHHKAHIRVGKEKHNVTLQNQLKDTKKETKKLIKSSNATSAPYHKSLDEQHLKRVSNTTKETQPVHHVFNLGILNSPSELKNGTATNGNIKITGIMNLKKHANNSKEFLDKIKKISSSKVPEDKIGPKVKSEAALKNNSVKLLKKDDLSSKKGDTSQKNLKTNEVKGLIVTSSAEVLAKHSKIFLKQTSLENPKSINSLLVSNENSKKHEMALPKISKNINQTFVGKIKYTPIIEENIVQRKTTENGIVKIHNDQKETNSFKSLIEHSSKSIQINEIVSTESYMEHYFSEDIFKPKRVSAETPLSFPFNMLKQIEQRKKTGNSDQDKAELTDFHKYIEQKNLAMHQRYPLKNTNKKLINDNNFDPVKNNHFTEHPVGANSHTPAWTVEQTNSVISYAIIGAIAILITILMIITFHKPPKRHSSNMKTHDTSPPNPPFDDGKVILDFDPSEDPAKPNKSIMSVLSKFYPDYMSYTSLKLLPFSKGNRSSHDEQKIPLIKPCRVKTSREKSTQEPDIEEEDYFEHELTELIEWNLRNSNQARQSDNSSCIDIKSVPKNHSLPTMKFNSDIFFHDNKLKNVYSASSMALALFKNRSSSRKLQEDEDSQKNQSDSSEQSEHMNESVKQEAHSASSMALTLSKNSSSSGNFIGDEDSQRKKNVYLEQGAFRNESANNVGINENCAIYDVNQEHYSMDSLNMKSVDQQKYVYDWYDENNIDVDNIYDFISFSSGEESYPMDEGGAEYSVKETTSFISICGDEENEINQYFLSRQKENEKKALMGNKINWAEVYPTNEEWQSSNAVKVPMPCEASMEGNIMRDNHQTQGYLKEKDDPVKVYDQRSCYVRPAPKIKKDAKPNGTSSLRKLKLSEHLRQTQSDTTHIPTSMMKVPKMRNHQSFPSVQAPIMKSPAEEAQSGYIKAKKHELIKRHI